MSIYTVDPGREHDQAFLQEFERKMEELEDSPDLELIDQPIPQPRTFDRIPDVLALNEHPITVTNPSKTWKTTAAGYFYPLNVDAVAGLVKLAEEQNRKIRVIGQRHSFSETCLNEDYFIDLSKAHPYNPGDHNQTVEKIDQTALSLLKETEDIEKYFDVPGGMQVYMINQILCPEDNNHKARFGRRRMFNMGGANVQSFAGAFSTGTHGSGGIFSTYHDMVCSILIVAGAGALYRIEPSNGITDKAKHDDFYKDKPESSKVQLIQDDDKFNAALVSFGCFGIIYSAIIETLPMSFLHKEIKYHQGKWSPATVKKSIDDIVISLNNTKEIFHTVQFNPYPIGKKKHPSYLIKTLNIAANQVVVGEEENPQKFPACFTNLPWAVGFIQFLTNHRLSPPRRFIEGVLKKIKKEEGRQDLAYKIWNAGAIGRLRNVGTGIEFAFPVSKVAEIINLIIPHLNQLVNLSPGYYVNGPIALRFVKASKAFLAPNQAKFKDEQHDWWCYIEIVRVSSTNPEDDEKELELYAHLQKMQMIGGRPHWGLNFQFPFDLEYLQSIYPDMDKWLEAKAFFDPNKTFESKAIQSWLS